MFFAPEGQLDNFQGWNWSVPGVEVAGRSPTSSRSFCPAHGGGRLWRGQVGCVGSRDTGPCPSGGKSVGSGLSPSWLCCLQGSRAGPCLCVEGDGKGSAQSLCEDEPTWPTSWQLLSLQGRGSSVTAMSRSVRTRVCIVFICVHCCV